MSTLPHHCVYARLGASKIHGVCVFAIMPIPKGTVVFAGDDQPIIWIKKSLIHELDPAHQKLYNDFGLHRGDEIACPVNFNTVTPGWCVNHNPDNPNLDYDSEDMQFIANRDIAIGEELTSNYHSYSDNIIST